MQIEYRVRAITRYIVTRNVRGSPAGKESTSIVVAGQDNFQTAYDAGYGLALKEAQELGLPPDDPTIVFPSPIDPIIEQLKPIALVKRGAQIDTSKLSDFRVVMVNDTGGADVETIYAPAQEESTPEDKNRGTGQTTRLIESIPKDGRSIFVVPRADMVGHFRQMIRDVLGEHRASNVIVTTPGRVAEINIGQNLPVIYDHSCAVVIL